MDTGEETLTGGRLKSVFEYVKNENSFCFTYGDGVSNVNIASLIDFHHKHGLNATVTAVQPPGRFGALEMDGLSVQSFVEKPHGDGMYINGGIFVLSPKVIDLIDNEKTIWEREPLERLAKSGQLQAFKHSGFWQPMDTLRDKNYLEELWGSGKAPWKTWE